VPTAFTGEQALTLIVDVLGNKDGTQSSNAWERSRLASVFSQLDSYPKELRKQGTKITSDLENTIQENYSGLIQM
jgi:hypothetical protein